MDAARSDRNRPGGGGPGAALTREAGQHGRGDDRFALLRRVAPLLDVVLEGHGRLAEAQRLAAVVLEALEGRHALHVQQRGLAVPGLQQGVRALEAVRAALGGVLLAGLPWRRQPGTLTPPARSRESPPASPVPPRSCGHSHSDCDRGLELLSGLSLRTTLP